MHDLNSILQPRAGTGLNVFEGGYKRHVTIPEHKHPLMPVFKAVAWTALALAAAEYLPTPLTNDRPAHVVSRVAAALDLTQ